MRSEEKRSYRLAKFFYHAAARMNRAWSAPHYNLGLMSKKAGKWEESLVFNQKAVELSPQNEAAWWNLGIAATALSNWAEARRAWKAYGIEIHDGDGEVQMSPISACVRLNPKESGEVVWGERLDPARIAILSVPLPESNRRFHDVLLNDGASSGTRKDSNGNEVPVFNELMIWKKSDYSTFAVQVSAPDESSIDDLVTLCIERDIGVEDWSTVRFICTECSRGNPGPHVCQASAPGNTSFGFAAKTKQDLIDLLIVWKDHSHDTEFSQPELVLGNKLLQ